MPASISSANLSLPEKIDHLENRIRQLEGLLSTVPYSMQRIAQTEMQDRIRLVPQSETQYGMYTAICVETVDIWKQNRVRFFCPLYHDPMIPVKSLPWAFPISPFGGFDDCGVTWVPPAGSTLCLVFEGGSRNAPFYLGTTWGRNRGPRGRQTWGVNVAEYNAIWDGHRGGYLVGPDDESQVLPPWNTENYNGFDLNSVADFDENPEAQKRITVPNIYGFKTPEKHMLKMVDGDPKCNRKWKRIELMSSCGNWMIFKDDHLHYGGQWAHPSCGAGQGDTSCVEGVGNPDPSQDTTRTGDTESEDAPPQFDLNAYLSDAIFDNFLSLDEAISIASATSTGDDPASGVRSEFVECEGQHSNNKIIGGHPRTPGGPCGTRNTKYQNSQVGANPFFKNKNECRPYQGLGIGGNKCDLPQSGIQIMSISGHTLVMDDSVEEPVGAPLWERSTEKFSSGCNGKYLGWMYFRSATGHQLSFIDTEDKPGIRGKDNGIIFSTANGNSIRLNDHTIPVRDCSMVTEGDPSTELCPPSFAGPERGIKFESSSTHVIQLCDEGNLHCAPCRTACPGPPAAMADKAYILIRSGYGIEVRISDSDSQKETRQQNLQIFCPQKDNQDRGPHIMRFQEAASGPGQIFLRAGGDLILSSNDNMIEIVGDKEKSPSDKMEVVSRNKVVVTEKDYMNLAQTHLLYAKQKILLLAGQDCPDASGEMGPCVGPVLVFVDGCVKLSDRIYGTASKDAPKCNIFFLDPLCSMSGGTE